LVCIARDLLPFDEARRTPSASRRRTLKSIRVRLKIYHPGGALASKSRKATKQKVDIIQLLVVTAALHCIALNLSR